MNKIVYNTYDKITDEMLYVGSHLRLNFTVRLSKVNNDVRYPMHKEYLVNSKTINSGALISIKRSFEYFIELIYKDNNRYISLKIVPENILYVLDELQRASLWFRNNDLFGVVNNNLVLLGTVEPITISFFNTKQLILEPIVYRTEFNQSQEARLRMIFDEGVYTDICIDKLMGMLYLLSKINMYESAQILINSIKPPEYGYNLIDMTSSASIDDVFSEDEYEENIEYKGSGRKVKANTSIFDKLDGK